MSAPELTRLVKTRPLPAEPVVVEADAAERLALAARFGLSAIENLRADVTLASEANAVLGTGILKAEVMQPCAVTGEDFAVSIDEPIALRFVRESRLREIETEDGEIEVDLSADDSDEIEYSGDAFDLGEAIAQTLGLAIDPYAEGPGADEHRRAAGIVREGEQEGPLAAALAALKKD